MYQIYLSFPNIQNLSQTHGLENMLKDGNKKGASLSLPGWQPLGTDSCSEISDDSSDEDHSEDNTQAMVRSALFSSFSFSFFIICKKFCQTINVCSCG